MKYCMILYEVVCGLHWKTLERNQERTSARRNALGISPLSFCRIIKKDYNLTP